MAKFYPTIDKNFHGSDGEQVVYDALRQRLSDQYTVFHSFVWLGSEKQRRIAGLEVQAILSVDFRFSEAENELARRIFYVGCSRANAYLQVALYKDTDKIKDAELLEKLGMG